MNTNHHPFQQQERDAARLTAYALGQLEAEERTAVENEVAASLEKQEHVEAMRVLGRCLSEATHHLDAPLSSSALRLALEQRLTVPAPQVSPEGAWLWRVFRAHPAAWMVCALAACVILAAIPLDLLLVSHGGVAFNDNSRPSSIPAENDQLAATPPSDTRAAGAAATVSDAEPSSTAKAVADPGEPAARQVAASPTPTTNPEQVDRRDVLSTPAEISDSRPMSTLLPPGAAIAHPIAAPIGPRPSGASPGERMTAEQHPRVPERLVPSIEQLHDGDPRKPKSKWSAARSLAGRTRPALPARKSAAVPPAAPAALASVPSDWPEPPTRNRPAESATLPRGGLRENDFRAVSLHPVSSLAFNANMAGYFGIREGLLQGKLPAPAAVPIEELINAFPPRVPVESATSLAAGLEVAECPWNRSHRLVQIVIHQRDQAGPEHSPAGEQRTIEAVEVEFNPMVADAYRLIGHEARPGVVVDPGENATAPSATRDGRTATVLYEVIPAIPDATPPARSLKYQGAARDLTAAAASRELLNVRIRHREAGQSEGKVTEFSLTDSGRSFAEASTDFRFVAAVAAFGLILQQSPHRGNATLAAVEDTVAAVIGQTPDELRAEFMELVHAARRVEGGAAPRTLAK